METEQLVPHEEDFHRRLVSIKVNRTAKKGDNFSRQIFLLSRLVLKTEIVRWDLGRLQGFYFQGYARRGNSSWSRRKEISPLLNLPSFG